MSVNDSSDVFPFMDVSELEKNMEESLTKIRSTISKANPLITLIQLHGHKFLNHLGNIEASVHGAMLNPMKTNCWTYTKSYSD